MASRIPLVFVHIPKTAGTTLTSVIAHRFRPEETHEVMMRGMSLIAPGHRLLARPLISFSAVRRLKAALQRPAAPRVIHGHLDLSLARWLPEGVRFLAMLRDPVERALSHHSHYRNRPGDAVHALALRSTLEEWVGERGLVEMDNGQTRRLAGAMDLPFGAVTRETLERAKQNLARRFAWIGLTERFAESQVLLHRLLGTAYHRYPALNIGADRPRRSSLPPATLRAVESRNAFDLELHAYASGLLDQAAGAIDMARELALLGNAPLLESPSRNPAKAGLQAFHPA